MSKGTDADASIQAHAYICVYIVQLHDFSGLFSCTSTHHIHISLDLCVCFIYIHI